ncbi:MAG: hypothetical protein A2Z98_17750 [Spirochaetes bacterium GWB1_27_13]|nr:MAG: hypothetical protein A2Z98_17750 [Spirochaetes bacterium GWB1_27_13]
MFDTGIKKLISFLEGRNNFIISGHENPDPDAICSCIALEYLLSTIGKNAIIVNSDPIPFNLVSLDYRRKVNTVEKLSEITNIKDYSLIIVDTNDTDNIGSIKTLINEVNSYFFIDHHSFKFEDIEHYLILVSASSTCEVIYKLYEYFNIDVPKEVGDAIYAGILFDSGSFHYPKTSSYTLQIASNIVDKGTNPNEIYLLLFEHESVESLKILSYVVSTLELVYNNQIAILTLTKDMLEKSGAKYEETSIFINIPLRSHLVKACIFFKENDNGTKRVSLRSKGNIDVAKLALNYDGGGHKNASGFKLSGQFKEFSDAKQIVIDYIIKEIEKNK